MLFVRQIIARTKFFLATKVFADFTPNCRDFTLLKKSTQLSWIERYYAEDSERLYEPEYYFGLSYPVELIDLEEYRRYPEDYGVVASLTNAGLEITEEREAAIEAGAELFPEEAEALIQRLAEADTDTWIGHHGFEIALSDGTLFAHFEGYSMGQVGVQFEYFNTFDSKEGLIAYIENKPLSMLEV